MEQVIRFNCLAIYVHDPRLGLEVVDYGFQVLIVVVFSINAVIRLYRILLTGNSQCTLVDISGIESRKLPFNPLG